MLQWETVDLGAIYLFERCLAVRGNYEFRIFYGPMRQPKTFCSER